MTKSSLHRAALAAVILVLLVAGLGIFLATSHRAEDDPGSVIALLIPDNEKANKSLVAIWLDAAREEGIRMEVLTDSEFLRPGIGRARREYAGIVMPDTVHKSANAVLLQRLVAYTQNGGKLMLVYDAATQTPGGIYYSQSAPLSSLLGMNYALYDTLLGHTSELGTVWGSHATMMKLGIPPGKTQRLQNPSNNINAGEQEVIVGYQYGALSYPSFVVRGNFPGEQLLSTRDGSLAAGYRDVGKGGLLFVNLPLGYLKGQTDGLLLHGFLHYFAETVLKLPIFSAAPNGQGGLIFNWHIDSNAAIAPIQELDKLGVLSQGPFSIHITAGPDARKLGDGLGLNLTQNPVMLQWIKRFKDRGDALGDHGGWIHDYFGLNVSEENHAGMEKYLDMNNRAMESVTASKIREYSAPVGTQPKWVTAWLESHGFVAYYFIGNTGMAPTRSYREGELFTPKIWSFPVVTLGNVASFEEFHESEIPEQEVADWLVRISDYAADNGTIRTFYSHPTGFHYYTKAIKKWFAHTQRLIDEHQFRWYTMTQLADFLSMREQTTWHILHQDGASTIEATNPIELEHMTWKLPKSGYEKPAIVNGEGAVTENNQYWLAIAGHGKVFRISSKLTSENSDEH